MKQSSHVISANPCGTLDCKLNVDVTCDGETIGFAFPQLSKPDDNIGPMVYVAMHGTTLVVRLTDRDGIDWGFQWNEAASKWYICDEPKRVIHA